MTESKQQKRLDETLEISLADIVQFIRKYIIVLLAVPFLGGILGILYSFTLPKLYISKSVLLPEYSMSSGSSFFSLAVGASQGGAENLVPDLYPEVLQSNPFGIYLLKQPVVDQDNVKYRSLGEYLSKSTKPGIFAGIFGSKSEEKTEKERVTPELLTKKEILSISRKETREVKSALSLISTTVEKKKGVITIQSETKDPIVSALVVAAGKEYLMKYVEDYRTYKANRQVEFLEERMLESKRKQQSTEYALQNYRDRNRNAFTNVARIEEMRLQSDFSLASSQYSSLTSQLEQARIKLKEEKPVFKVLEPASVALDKSSPKRLTSGVIGAFLAAVLIIFYLLIFKEKVYKAFI